tara:strand:+ start:58 stop:669 length:612 start_codon:yes stop_codon:yes gene_type:complete
MPFPTNAVSTELDAVNEILSSVGQAPVTTLNLQNPEVAIPFNTLKEVSKEVQLEGWSFNVERDYEITPDTNDEIKFPSNVLYYDSNRHHRDAYDLVRRDGKLYDRLNHTYKFTKSIRLDITWYFDFQDLPPAIQAYITARAARICAVRMIGDQNLQQMLEDKEQITRAFAIEQDCAQGDYSMFGWRDGENYYNTYQPFHALRR